ncbi:MAG: trypsin-like peptidase domain-containing protein [bacterium]|nr:trypsin-like peptidase domain-containing protein [bacterium]
MRNHVVFGTFLAMVPLLVAPHAVAEPTDPGTVIGPEKAVCGQVPTGITQVGEEVRLTFKSPAVAIDLRGLPYKAAPRMVWSEEIYSPEASYIAPHFGRFDLPPGSYLIVRSPDGSRSWKYTGFGKGTLGRSEGFWGIHIHGDTAILELYSNRPLPAAMVEVDSFARGYAQISVPQVPAPDPEPLPLPDPDPEPLPLPDPEGEEAICGADDSQWAKCYESSEPTVYDRSRAVARLLINGTGACTGWLVGSAGHLLTNEHCIDDATTAMNTNYEFMAEGSTCTTNCGSWFACPGTVVATSATLVRSDWALDYTLVQLPTNPTPTYGYLQLRPSGAVVDERMYIPQHPQGWGKRIGVSSTAPADQSGWCEVYSLDRPGCSGRPGPDVGYYCDTQGGSSGSPVIGYGDHLVVALHHCAYCPNRGVPIQEIITDLDIDLPPDAIGGVPEGYYRCLVDISGGTDTCDDGIVTLTTNSDIYRVAEIDLSDGYQRLDVLVDVCDPDGWVMHFTDSPSGNGGGGDGSDTTHDAEAHVNDTSFSMWGTYDYDRSVLDPAAVETSVIPATGCFQVQWSIEEDLLMFDNDGVPGDSAKIRLQSFRSFELAPYDEPDSEDPSGLDADLWYAGLNRTVGTASRSGTGVNRACFVLSESTTPDPAILTDLCAAGN